MKQPELYTIKDKMTVTSVNDWASGKIYGNHNHVNYRSTKISAINTNLLKLITALNSYCFCMNDYISNRVRLTALIC